VKIEGSLLLIILIGIICFVGGGVFFGSFVKHLQSDKLGNCILHDSYDCNWICYKEVYTKKECIDRKVEGYTYFNYINQSCEEFCGQDSSSVVYNSENQCYLSLLKKMTAGEYMAYKRTHPYNFNCYSK